MNTSFNEHNEAALQTECGRQFGNVFQAMKLVRDEKHNFHVVYKTFDHEYIYSFCNPFLDTLSGNTYRLISEDEAKEIFLHRLSQENACELFETQKASITRILS